MVTVIFRSGFKLSWGLPCISKLYGQT